MTVLYFTGIFYICSNIYIFNMKLSKTYTDIETGHIIEKISEHLFYNKELKRVIITRLPLFDEENDLPTNNEYPYGQTDFLYLKATDSKRQKILKFVIMEEVNKGALFTRQ